VKKFGALALLMILLAMASGCRVELDQDPVTTIPQVQCWDYFAVTHCVQLNFKGLVETKYHYDENVIGLVFLAVIIIFSAIGGLVYEIKN
jgi:hypothetical protein